MTFGTADRRKADVAEGVALAIGHVATRRGNRLGVLAVRRRRAARAHARARAGSGCSACSRELRAEPGADGAGATSLGDGAAPRRPRWRARAGCVVVVSDFRGARDWEGPLRSLRARHGVLAVEIRDPRELELPPMGDVWVVDPETGRQIAGQHRRGARSASASPSAAAAEREEVAAAIRRAGADHVVLSTEGDWLRDLAHHLRRGEAAVRAGSPSRAAVVAPPRGRRRPRPRAPAASRPPGAGRA